MKRKRFFTAAARTLPALLTLALACATAACSDSDDTPGGEPGKVVPKPDPDPDPDPDPSGPEVLYNGIRLPETWPPRNLTVGSAEPMPVPYLAERPEVIPIDVGRQLFVDDFLIESTTLSHRYHAARKYAGNPILQPETALEKPSSHFAGFAPKDGGIWWEPREGCFKMWYEAGWLYKMAYATSTDGLNWTRPDLGNGTNELRSLSDLTPNSCAVVLDYDGPDNERYKLFFRQPNANTAADQGFAMVSADGKTWSRRKATGPCGDRSTMFYNPFRKKWVFSVRSVGALGPTSPRTRYYREHGDFLTGAAWSAANVGRDIVFWCRADRLDEPDPELGTPPQLYNVNAVGYESIMLGLHQILLDDNNAAIAAGRPKVTELKIAFSRDGFHWSRPSREPFIGATRTVGSWDRGYIQSVGGICTVVGDQLRFYYIGFRGDENRPGHSAAMHANSATGIAVLRRDGFCSMSTDSEGTLTTRPVTFSGKYLFVNVNCPAGELRAEVLDSKGEVVAGFSAAECRPVQVDATLQQIGWTGGSDLSALAGHPVRFRFTLRNGDLYAFWVSPGTAGESNGYVAGGGPGFTGNRDTEGSRAYRAAAGPQAQLIGY